MKTDLIKRRIAVALAVITVAFLCAPGTGLAGGWDVTGSTPITIINHSPTITGFDIENMFGSTTYNPTWGTINHAIFADNSGNAGYVDYVEWRTSSAIDLPGFHLYANKDGTTTNRMFMSFALYYSDTSGTTWTKFYEKNVVNDYSGTAGLDLSVPSSSFILPVQGKQYFRAEFVRGGDDPNVDGPRVIELDTWPSFNYIEVRSNNQQPFGWQLNTAIILNDGISPTLTYSVDGSVSNQLSRVTVPFYQNTYLYDASVTGQLGGYPNDYNGKTFTWTVDDITDLTATATVSSGIRQVPLSTNLTISGDPTHPTVAWYNPDPNLDQYVVRVIVGDLSQGWVWQTSLPYSSYGANPSYTINDFTFEPGINYWIRIEARDWLDFPFAVGSDIPTPTTRLQLLNRSTVVRDYWIAEEGDFNGDHLVSITDAITALKVISGVTVEKALGKNDINGDGRIGLEDAACVLQYVAGIRNSPYTDNDGDGYTGMQGDCDDNDPNRNPGAVEICGDGIDQDCNGSDLPCPGAFPDIRGIYNGSYTIQVWGCTDPSSNGTYVPSVVINIPNQNENAFDGTAVGTFHLGDFSADENITYSGTITLTGAISGNSFHTFLGTGGAGTFTGQLTGNTLTITNSGHDTYGETCSYTRDISATR
jgi:hypothetical protein